MNVGLYGKSITYIILAAVTFLVTALSDNTVSGEELVNLAVVIVGAIGVYAIPNFPEGVAKYVKTGVTLATAGLMALLSFWSDGITTTEWLQIGVAALSAIGVFIVPNTLGSQKADTVVINNSAPLTVVDTHDGKTGV